MNAHVGGVAAGKFKVGDRVRVHGHPYGSVEQDAEGIIVRRREFTRGPWEVRADNGCVLTFLEGEMTLIPTFAVGDRVRIKSGPDNGGYGAIGDVGMVAEIGGDSLYMKFETGAEAGESWWILPKHLEPAPLRIEAGKYYLTRDGRRVGPAVVDDGWTDYIGQKGDFHIAGQGLYTAGGRWLTSDGPSKHDLVAEAPTPAKGNPAAQVDNLADEYGAGKRKDEPKFKVGDRVRVIKRGRDARSGHGRNLGEMFTLKEFTIGKFWRTNYGPDFYPDEIELVSAVDNTTLIVALIENGQPKPAPRPYIHRSREAATAEAGRLAGIHKGQEFGVFELVDTRKVEKPAPEHEWQWHAEVGDRNAAASRLMKLSGLTRKQALAALDAA